MTSSCQSFSAWTRRTTGKTRRPRSNPTRGWVICSIRRRFRKISPKLKENPLSISQVTEASGKKFRLRLYSTGLSRDADVSRPYSVPLALRKQHGCILDLLIDQNTVATAPLFQHRLLSFFAFTGASQYLPLANRSSCSEAWSSKACLFDRSGISIFSRGTFRTE